MAGEQGSVNTESLDSDDKLAGIPTVEFVEDVDAFMNLPENANNAQTTLKRIEEFYHRIKLLESNNANTKRRLKSQIEELGKTLDMLEELKKRKAANEDLVTHFRLADHVFIKARAKPVEKVGLWLGANVMLEYEVDEGEKLLREKRGKAEESLKTTNALIDGIREQITTVEVNMARIYNWDVKRRQGEKQKAGIKE